MRRSAGAAMILHVAVLFAAAIFSSSACRQPDAEKGPAPTPDAGPVSLPPLVAPALSQMPVAGFAHAVFVSPVGATKPMPLVVAVLGIGDTPESQCAVWRELVGKRAFVICPRFTPHYVPAQAPEPNPAAVGQGLLGLLGLQGDTAPEADPNSGAVVQSGFRPTEVPEVEREIDAAIAAARKIFPKYIASGPALYVGFSRGAFLGASLVAKNPAKYPRAIMIEGGQSSWTDAVAATYAKGGGKRVLFACGQPACVSESEPASQLLVRAKVATRIVHGEGEGHNYKGPVKEQIRAALTWVTEDDAVWKATR
jgi:predicted esterase